MSNSTRTKETTVASPSNKLKPGCHVCMVAQNKGGEAKSITVLEFHLTAMARGIPSILATLDQSNATLAIALGSSEKIMSLNMGSANDLQRALNDAMDAAENAGAILIIDTPPAYVDVNHPLIPALTRSRVFETENSIAAIIPIRPMGDAILGAVDALRVMPVDFSRGLIRAWHHDPAAPKWDSMPGFDSLKARFPVWNVGTWMQSTEDIVHKQGDFSNFPNLDDLAEYSANHGMGHSRYERSAIRVTLAHFDDAQKAIYKHLIEPILA